jgi:CRISPR-associated protein Csb2
VQLSELKLRDNDGHYVATAMRVLQRDSVFDRYLTDSKRWITVTPTILPGYDDRDQRKRRKLIVRMFEHAGLPRPISVTELPGQRIHANSRHGHDKYKQVNCAIEFAREVSGTVALGTGRHYGLGLFANLG